MCLCNHILICALHTQEFLHTSRPIRPSKCVLTSLHVVTNADQSRTMYWNASFLRSKWRKEASKQNGIHHLLAHHLRTNGAEPGPLIQVYSSDSLFFPLLCRWSGHTKRCPIQWVSWPYSTVCILILFWLIMELQANMVQKWNFADSWKNISRFRR